MSRIKAVRSTTFTFTLSSKFRSCPGLNSPSQITVSAPVDLTTPFNSLTFPDPIKVAGSGLSRLWINASRTSEPAVSASAANSAIEFSASFIEPSVQTPTKTTRSNLSLRYSASEISVSSVDRPATRRSAWRSLKSRWVESKESGINISESNSAARSALS